MGNFVNVEDDPEPRSKQNRAELILAGACLLSLVLTPYIAPVLMVGGILGIEHHYRGTP